MKSYATLLLFSFFTALGNNHENTGNHDFVSKSYQPNVTLFPKVPDNLRMASPAIETALLDLLTTLTTKPPFITRGSCDLAAQITQNQNGISVSIPSGSPAGGAAATSTSNTNRITQSGLYCVVDNLTVQPVTNQQAGQRNGLIIAADDVFIDMNDYCIKGSQGTRSGIGILIEGNHFNITIVNGCIDMMGNGIQINSGNQGIILDNMKIFRSRTNGISMQNVSSCALRKCIAVANGTSGVGSGFNIALSQSFSFDNCIAILNRGDGYQTTSSRNFSINNSVAFGNIRNGFNLVNAPNQRIGQNFRFLNCTALNNMTNGFASGGNDHHYEQCQANNNTQNGFAVTNNQQSLVHCTAKGNGTNGFQINGMCHTLLNSIAASNINSGILLQPNSSRCQVRDNTTLCNRFGLNNRAVPLVNRMYRNWASDNDPTEGANFFGVPNTVLSPTAFAVFNFTGNVAN